ncbi:MAG: hypothetical protein U0326_19755 [Polyangiales bacterium]
MRRPLCALLLSLGCASAQAQPSPSRAARDAPPRVSLDRLRDGDGERFGRELARSPAPIQLPRIVAAGNRWGITWSERTGTSQLEVHAASLDATLTPSRHAVVTPRDGHLSAFAYAAPRSENVWAVVFDDDRTSRAGWFERVDLDDDAVSASQALPHDDVMTHSPVVAWNAARNQWGALAQDNGRVVFHTFSRDGAIADVRAVTIPNASYLTIGAPPLIVADGRWSALLIRQSSIALATFDGPTVEPAIVELGRETSGFNGMALDWDGEGYGVAWSTAGAGVRYVHVGRDLVAGAPLTVSDARYANLPSLAWNGRHHVIVWTEQPADTPLLRLSRITPQGALLPARTVMSSHVGAEAWFPFLCAGGAGGRDVALTWQVGQSVAMGMILTP